SAEENRMPPEIYPTPDAVAGTLHVAIMWRAASIIIFSAGAMIARARPGSRSCWSSVEPLLSAKSAVTVLRSPSRFAGTAASVGRIRIWSDFFRFGKVLLPRDHSAQHPPPARPEQVGDYRAELDIGVFEHFLDALLVSHYLPHQLFARAG